MSDVALKPRLVVTFVNGSGSVHTFKLVSEAYEYARTRISFAKVARVELIVWPTTARALWDCDWSPESQALGLELPL